MPEDVRVTDINIRPLAEHLDLLPTLATWFEAEWPAYYGPDGRGSAKNDLLAYASRDGLPFGLVAFRSGVACGFGALKREAFPTHPHLSPWAGAAYVVPSLRGRGVGAALLSALEAQARLLGHSHVYCATGTSESLLQRNGWRLLSHVLHDGQQLGVYEKGLL